MPTFLQTKFLDVFPCLKNVNIVIKEIVYNWSDNQDLITSQVALYYWRQRVSAEGLTNAATITFPWEIWMKFYIDIFQA